MANSSDDPKYVASCGGMELTVDESKKNELTTRPKSGKAQWMYPPSSRALFFCGDGQLEECSTGVNVGALRLESHELSVTKEPVKEGGVRVDSLIGEEEGTPWTFKSCGSKSNRCMAASEDAKATPCPLFTARFGKKTQSGGHM